MKNVHQISIALTIALLAPTTLAQHGGDIFLTVQNGAIHTGSISEDGVTIIPNVRVFESPMGEVAPGFTDEPGFDNFPGTFPVPSTIGFRLRKALRVWQSDNFDAISTGSIDVAFGPIGPISTPPTDTIVSGFSLTVGSNGEWHRHLEHTLAAPQTDGIYLMELSLFSSRPDIAESQPFWLVFGNNADDQDLDDAVRWTRSHLACRADFNGDGAAGVQDIFDFLAAYFASTPAADFNGLGGVTVQDIFDYLAAYFAGCGV